MMTAAPFQSGMVLPLVSVSQITHEQNLTIRFHMDTIFGVFSLAIVTETDAKNNGQFALHVLSKNELNHKAFQIG